MVNQKPDKKSDKPKSKRGGFRVGAGRKPKTVGSSSEAALSAWELRTKYTLSPLEYMLQIVNSVGVKGVTAERRDNMAKAAAPYMHARLQSVDINTIQHGPMRYSLDLTKLSDEELMQFERILAKAQVPVEMLDTLPFKAPTDLRVIEHEEADIDGA